MNSHLFPCFSVIEVCPFLGQVVAVRVGQDWFRAQIVRKLDSLLDSLMDSNNFLVKLVDTGKVEIVSQEAMKVLQKEFLSLPRQVKKH